MCGAFFPRVVDWVLVVQVFRRLAGIFVFFCQSNMKASKRGFEWSCGHGQHVLNKHDQDIRHTAIDNTSWTSMIVTNTHKKNTY